MPLISTLAGGSARGFGGMKTFGVPYAGPYGAYDALSSVTLSSGTGTITFTGIPNEYKHLQLRGITLSSSPNNGVAMRFNSDSSANYSLHGLEGNGSTSAVSPYGSASGTTANAGYTGDATYPSTFICDIFDYSSNTKSKTIRAISGNDANATGARYTALLSARYGPLDAINSITITHGAAVNFNQYSQFALYGVK
jgi:hypothetical protein